MSAPQYAEIYRRKVADLARAISSDTGTGKTAVEAIRSLIESVSVRPEGEAMAVELVGELAPDGETMTVELVGELGGILSIASRQKAKGPTLSGEPSSAKLVAGHRTLLCRTEVLGLFRASA